MTAHKNPIGFFTLRGTRKEIRPLVMIPQYVADFIVAIAPKIDALCIFKF